MHYRVTGSQWRTRREEFGDVRLHGGQLARGRYRSDSHIVIGTVWCLPAVFGNRWAALIGRDIAARPSPTVYVVGLIGAVGIGHSTVIVMFISGWTMQVMG